MLLERPDALFIARLSASCGCASLDVDSFICVEISSGGHLATHYRSSVSDNHDITLVFDADAADAAAHDVVAMETRQSRIFLIPNKATLLSLINLLLYRKGTCYLIYYFASPLY